MFLLHRDWLNGSATSRVLDVGHDENIRKNGPEPPKSGTVLGPCTKKLLAQIAAGDDSWRDLVRSDEETPYNR